MRTGLTNKLKNALSFGGSINSYTLRSRVTRHPEVQDCFIIKYERINSQMVICKFCKVEFQDSRASKSKGQSCSHQILTEPVRNMSEIWSSKPEHLKIKGEGRGRL